MEISLVLRGFVVLGVMLMHTTWFFTKNHSTSWLVVSEMLLDIFSLVAVPLFMFISGYLFSIRHGHAYKYQFRFFYKMTKSVFLPYVSFSLLYMVGNYIFHDGAYSWMEVCFNIVTAQAAIHLGFFRSLVGFYVVYPVLLKCFKGCIKRHRLGWYFGIVSVLQIGWKIGNQIEWTAAWMQDIIWLTSFLRYIVYFSLGMAAVFFGKSFIYWIVRNRLWLAVTVGVCVPLVMICWMAKYYWHKYYLLEFMCFPLNLFLYTALIGVLFEHANRLHRRDTMVKRFITYIGNYSFGIFLMHIGFMYAGTEWILPVFALQPTDFLFYPVLFVLMLLMSVLAMECLIRLPFHRYLVGHVVKPFNRE